MMLEFATLMKNLLNEKCLQRRHSAASQRRCGESQAKPLLRRSSRALR